MRLTIVVLSSLLLIASALPAMAQLGTEGSILGIVHDSSGAVVPGATVTVTNTETGLKMATVTNSDGYFQVLALPRGIYSVQVSSPSFAAWQINAVPLTAGEQKRVQP